MYIFLKRIKSSGNINEAILILSNNYQIWRFNTIRILPIKEFSDKK